MKLKSLLFTFITLMALIVTIVDYIYLQHKTRNKFIEIQNLIKEENHLNAEWGRLQIAHSTFVNNNRIEKKAKLQLGMNVPKSNQIININRK